MLRLRTANNDAAQTIPASGTTPEEGGAEPMEEGAASAGSRQLPDDGRRREAGHQADGRARTFHHAHPPRHSTRLSLRPVWSVVIIFRPGEPGITGRQHDHVGNARPPAPHDASSPCSASTNELCEADVPNSASLRSRQHFEPDNTSRSGLDSVANATQPERNETPIRSRGGHHATNTGSQSRRHSGRQHQQQQQQQRGGT